MEQQDKFSKGQYLDLKLVMDLPDEEHIQAFFRLCELIDQSSINGIKDGNYETYYEKETLGVDDPVRRIDIVKYLFDHGLIKSVFGTHDLIVNSTIYQTHEYAAAHSKSNRDFLGQPIV